MNENGYGPPPGFCYDEYCADQPIMDNPKLEGYNVQERVETFVKEARRQVGTTGYNHVISLADVISALLLITFSIS